MKIYALLVGLGWDQGDGIAGLYLSPHTAQEHAEAVEKAAWEKEQARKRGHKRPWEPLKWEEWRENDEGVEGEQLYCKNYPKWHLEVHVLRV